MRDLDPCSATFEAESTLSADSGPNESARDLEAIDREARWSRPSIHVASLGALDVHDRPTLVP